MGQRDTSANAACSTLRVTSARSAEGSPSQASSSQASPATVAAAKASATGALLTLKPDTTCAKRRSRSAPRTTGAEGASGGIASVATRCRSHRRTRRNRSLFTRTTTPSPRSGSHGVIASSRSRRMLVARAWSMKGRSKPAPRKADSSSGPPSASSTTSPSCTGGRTPSTEAQTGSRHAWPAGLFWRHETVTDHRDRPQDQRLRAGRSPWQLGSEDPLLDPLDLFARLGPDYGSQPPDRFF